MVRAVASYQLGPGSIPVNDDITLLMQNEVVVYSLPWSDTVFFYFLVLPLSSKKKERFINSNNSVQYLIHIDQEALIDNQHCGRFFWQAKANCFLFLMPQPQSLILSLRKINQFLDFFRIQHGDCASVNSTFKHCVNAALKYPKSTVLVKTVWLDTLSFIYRI